MHVIVLNCNTMHDHGTEIHDHGTEIHGHVLFHVTWGNTSGMCIETRFNCFNLRRAKQTLTIGTLYH